MWCAVWGEGIGTRFPADYRVHWEVGAGRKPWMKREWDWLNDLARAGISMIDEIAGDEVPAQHFGAEAGP